MAAVENSPGVIASTLTYGSSHLPFNQLRWNLFMAFLTLTPDRNNIPIT